MPRKRRKWPVRRCQLVGCVGGQDGRNGSGCVKAKWDYVTPEEALDLYAIHIDIKEDAVKRTSKRQRASTRDLISTSVHWMTWYQRDGVLHYDTPLGSYRVHQAEDGTWIAAGCGVITLDEMSKTRAKQKVEAYVAAAIRYMSKLQKERRAEAAAARKAKQ